MNIILRQLVDAPLVKPAQCLIDSSQTPPLYRYFHWVCKNITLSDLFRPSFGHNIGRKREKQNAVSSSN